MCRILRPGGRALIYAWAQEQERDSKPSTYLKQQKSECSTKNSETSVELNLKDVESSEKVPLVLPVHKNRTNFEHSDLLVPWKTKSSNEMFENGDSKTFLRFYHVFKEQELENLIQKSPVLSGQMSILESYYDQGNWCVILSKKS